MRPPSATAPPTFGPYGCLWLDALTRKVREGGRVTGISCVVAIAVSAGGRREAPGCGFVTTEDGAGWTAFLRGLLSRGLSGVRLAVSGAQAGRDDTAASALSGAAWQRCRAHFARSLLSKAPQASQDPVATAPRPIFAQPEANFWRQHAAVVEQLEARFRKAAEMPGAARAGILAYASFPKAHWRQIWSGNPRERLNREIRRRPGGAGIFPNRQATVRLAGAVPAERTASGKRPGAT